MHALLTCRFIALFQATHHWLRLVEELLLPSQPPVFLASPFCSCFGEGTLRATFFTLDLTWPSAFLAAFLMGAGAFLNRFWTWTGIAEG